MELQTLIDNAVKSARAEEMKTSEQLTLGELILKIESIGTKADKKYDNKNGFKDIKFDFENARPTGLDSYRGFYRELAISFSFDWDSGNDFNAEWFLQELKKAVGKTYTGYKGGDFVMGKITPVWVANYGNTGRTAVIDVIDEEYNIVLVTKYMRD